MNARRRSDPGSDQGARRQYRRILNNIPAEIGVLDTDGRYLFNTPSGIRDPGVREWMLGKTNHEWVRERGHPVEIADKRQAAVDHCVTEKESVTFEEIWTGQRGSPTLLRPHVQSGRR